MSADAVFGGPRVKAIIGLLTLYAVVIGRPSFAGSVRPESGGYQPTSVPFDDVAGSRGMSDAMAEEPASTDEVSLLMLAEERCQSDVISAPYPSDGWLLLRALLSTGISN